VTVYHFGDAHPIVELSLDRDGWEWFVDLCRSTLSATDTFLKDVEIADAYLAPDDQDDDE
jgi:hypothetical protein